MSGTSISSAINQVFYFKQIQPFLHPISTAVLNLLIHLNYVKPNRMSSTENKVLDFCVLHATTISFTIFLNHFSLHHTEPVGSKAPTFSTELKSGTYEKRIGQSFALLCLAQAFPVPLIRFVTITFVY